MNDLIDREKAIDVISKLPVKIDNLGYTWMISIDVLKQIDNIPSVEPKRKMGKWIEDETGYGYWTCSVCGFVTEASVANILYHYCPNCGSDMRMRGEE